MAEPLKRTLVTPITPHEPISIRRYEMPDLDRHAPWLVPRLTAVYQSLTPQVVVGWLRGMLYNAEFLFLFQDDAIACAQAVSGHTLSPRPVIEERFILVREPDNKAMIASAARFYDDFVRWAKAKDAEGILLSDHSDVPVAVIQEKTGARVFTREQNFLRW